MVVEMEEVVIMVIMELGMVVVVVMIIPPLSSSSHELRMNHIGLYHTVITTSDSCHVQQMIKLS